MKAAILRVREIMRDVARAARVREEGRLQALLVERTALGPAPVPDNLTAVQDLAFFLAHEARKHREVLALSGRIEEQEAAVVQARTAEQREMRRLKAVVRLLDRRRRTARRTRQFRLSRELEDLMVRREVQL